jgi:prophage regulatory protein
MQEQVFLTDRAVAARYSVGRSTVWRWAQHGQFPSPVRLQGISRWRLADLLAHEAKAAQQGGGGA